MHVLRGVGTVLFRVKQPRILLIFLHFFPQKLVCQPLISGEAGASPASPVPTPLFILYNFFLSKKSNFCNFFFSGLIVKLVKNILLKGLLF